MKEKILYLILGILIGAVITAGCFLVFQKNSRPEMKGERPNFEDMDFPEDGNFEKGNHMRNGRNEASDLEVPTEQPKDNQVDSEV